MKNKFLLLLFINLIFVELLASDKTLRIMTYNIRYANNYPGEEWEIRKDKVAEMIRFHLPDIFGVQEALNEQVKFLSNTFKDYNYVGVGREDGIDKGEFSAIFISSKFNILDNGTFWLSETPDTVSVGWDAALERIATWAIVEDKNTKDTLIIVNTHFDHIGVKARLKSARLIMEKIEELYNQKSIFLIGDFNFTESSRAYKAIQNFGLIKDSRYTAKYIYGTDVTFNGFNDTLDNKNKIDYIFVSDNVLVIHHAIIGDKSEGSYPSDHMPVIVDFSIIKN